MDRISLNEKYDYLKDKLNFISEDAEILSGDNDMVELDPDNPHHREWFNEKLTAHKLREKIGIDTSLTGKGLVDLSREGR